MSRYVEARFTTPEFSGDELEVVELRGREKLSGLFDFEVTVTQRRGHRLDSTRMLGDLARLELFRDGELRRRISGIVAGIRVGLDSESGLHNHTLRLAPRAHLTTLIEIQEIYQDLSVPGIVKVKLDLLDLNHQLRLSSTYPERDFVVQYAESDHAFINRLCEHLGICYFFDEGEDGEVMVFTDDNSFRALDEKISFSPHGDRVDIYALEYNAGIVPAHYLVSDYNYRTPLIDISGSCELAAGFGGGVVEYGSHAKTPDEAAALALIRAEERECRRQQFLCQSDRPELGAGIIFQLTGHPDFTEKLLVVESEHHVRQVTAGQSEGGLAYENRFRAIPSSTPFRPARVTPRPRIYGITNGIVEPQPGSTTQPWIDEDGRYRIRILFDSSGNEGKKASRPIRMAQQHAGANYGTHFPLRPYTEVLLSFIDGDVDRPIIMGAVPNALTPTPVTAKNAMHHQISTASGVKIEFEDGF